MKIDAGARISVAASRTLRKIKPFKAQKQWDFSIQYPLIRQSKGASSSFFSKNDSQLRSLRFIGREVIGGDGAAAAAVRFF